MNFKATGEPLDVVCKEQVFPEFPELLMGETIDNVMYYDITHYLKNHPIQIDDFFKDWSKQISILCDSYGIDKNDILINNKEGSTLLNGMFIFLFISFINQDFLAYISECMFELLTTGVCVSDSYLSQKYHMRFVEDDLKFAGDERFGDMEV